MFGHFRHRRGLRRLARRPLQAAYLQSLNETNRLAAGGQNDQAGQQFSRLAQAAQDAGYLRQAANLHARAALAGAANGPAYFALEQARSAMQEFVQQGMVVRAAGFLATITAELRAHGMGSVADALEHEFGDQAVAPVRPVATDQMKSPAHLPATCPQCGAPARSDEVEWIDASSAECAYCGGVILAS